jgi:hypothetical protein
VGGFGRTRGRAGGQIAIGHLLALGHRRVAYVRTTSTAPPHAGVHRRPPPRLGSAQRGLTAPAMPKRPDTCWHWRQKIGPLHSRSG